MDHRPVVLVALVVLAGCGGAPFGGGSAPTRQETLTPVPISPTGDQPRTSTPVDRPPGVSVVGPVNATRLRVAHESFVAGLTYTWELDFDVQRSPRPDPVFDQGFGRRAVVEGDRFLVEQIGDGSSLEQYLYVDDSGGYLRAVRDNETEHDAVRDPGDVDDYVVSGEVVERFLTGMNPNVTRIQRDGRTYFRLYADVGLPPALDRLSTRVRNYRVTVYVTPEGFVRSMVVRYDRSWHDGEESVSIRFDYSAVGETSVEAPDWVEGISFETPTPTPETPATPETPTPETLATPTPTPPPVSVTTVGPSSPTGTAGTATTATDTASPTSVPTPAFANGTG